MENLPKANRSRVNVFLEDLKYNDRFFGKKSGFGQVLSKLMHLSVMILKVIIN